MIRARLFALFAALFVAPAAAGAVTCEEMSWQGNTYDVCRVNAQEEHIQLFLYTPEEKVWGEFTTLADALSANGKELLFAMNAGMYHQDRSPVGHYKESGQELMRVIPGAGPGNFGMVPNGVFCVSDNRARVYETQRFLDEEPRCRDATQSGPMLVIDGELHPRFLPDSTSRYLRNGVGTFDDGGEAIFVMSRNVVTFHAFASFFRDGLGVDQALYFDGNVSRIYAPDLGRNDLGRKMGPIVGVTADKPGS